MTLAQCLPSVRLLLHYWQNHSSSEGTSDRPPQLPRRRPFQLPYDPDQPFPTALFHENIEAKSKTKGLKQRVGWNRCAPNLSLSLQGTRTCCTCTCTWAPSIRRDVSDRCLFLDFSVSVAPECRKDISFCADLKLLQARLPVGRRPDSDCYTAGKMCVLVHQVDLIRLQEDLTREVQKHEPAPP